MFLINFPLMIIPFAVYNFFIIGGEGPPWNDAAFAFTTGSGTAFTITLGHVLIVVALVFMMIEALKARCAEVSTAVDHVLSLAVLIAYGAEFYFIELAATPTFFLLMVITLFSLVTSLLLSRPRSERVTIER